MNHSHTLPKNRRGEDTFLEVSITLILKPDQDNEKKSCRSMYLINIGAKNHQQSISKPKPATSKGFNITTRWDLIPGMQA